MFHSAGPDLPIPTSPRSSELTLESGMSSDFSRHGSVNFQLIHSPPQISTSSGNNAITLYSITSVKGKIFTAVGASNHGQLIISLQVFEGFVVFGY